jgi:integrase
MSTGSIYVHKATGYWVAAVSVGGKRITKYAKTEREARQLLKALQLAEGTRTLAAPTKFTVSEWMAHWLSTQETQRRASTLRTYRQTMSPLVEQLGSVRLDKLSPVALERTLTTLLKRGRGVRRVALGYAALHTCLGAAVRLGILATNPLDRVQRPAYATEVRECWTDAEVQRFLSVSTSSSLRYSPLLLLLIGGGLRLSEGLAVTWDDVDFTAGTLKITKALVFAGGCATLERTKSKAGTRTIVLPRFVLEALGRLPRPLDSSARMFRTTGELPPGQTVLRQTMKSLCRAAGVPRIHIHGLRHSHASILVAEGVDLASVSKRLGHSRISTTTDIYIHSVRPDRAAVVAFERAIARGSGEERRA